MSQDGDEGSEANMSTKADIGDTTDEEEDVELLELDEDEGEVDDMTTNPDASMASSTGDKGSKSGKIGDTEYEEEEGEDFSVLSDITANSDIPVDDEFKQAELEAKRKAQEEAHLRRSKWALDIEEAPPEDNDEDEDEEGPEDKVEQEGDSKGSKRKRKAMNASSKTTAETKKKKQQSEKVEEVWVEPTYDSADFVSGPILSPGSDMYTGTLHMYQSYGYDCLRPYNLHVLDDDTLAFITGNYVQFYSIAEKQVTALRRSASGYGVGHIAIHPNKKYYGVAEKGDWPYIMIYTWPQQRVYRVLRKGTTRSYSYINFSPDGELLCSQGMDPDYLLTIWRWERERIVLHVKAFSQDIYRATFSTTHPGYVTTCGLAHIRFWKMAQTFTGLKLQGAIGRFGKTEISDITGFAGLPDGKIVSGSEWGNMLVWDGGLIVVEVMSKNGKNCHDGEITDLVLLETGELVTIGLDGCLRTWESEVIDLADTVVDDSGKHELEALNEYKLSTVAQPISMVRRITGAEDEATWFVQDGWGKVWSVNLHMINKEDYTPGVIFLCPGGAVRAVAASPSYSIFVIGTSTGHLWVFEYLTKWVLAKLKYNVAVTKLLWLPTHLDPKGLSFLAAFADGHVRLFYVHRIREPEVREDHSDTEDEELPYEYSLLQILRFHKGAITVMLLDQTDVLYTCGEDRLIFASKLELNPETNRAKITPLSFVTAPFPVISLDLHPIKDYRLIIASKNGRVAECRKPIWSDLGTETSYNGGKLHGRRWQYTSVKSKRRKDERREARKLELEQKLVELRNDIAERRAKGAFVEEEIEVNRVVDKFRRDQLIDDEEELYIPEKPCPVYHAYYGINKNLNRDSLSRNFFLHAGGYDAGYVYECKCSRPDAGGFHPVPPTPNFSADVAVRCFTCSPDDEYLIFGMEDGSIRVMPRTNAEKKKLEKLATQSQLADQLIAEAEDQQSDLFQQEEDTGKQQKKKKKVLPPFPESVFPYDLVNFVCVPMHDPDRGSVNDFAWSYDGKFLFSVGEDGGIFSYRWDPMGVLHGTDMDEGNPMDPPEEPPIPTTELVEDTQDPNALTLEELKIKAEKDRLWQLAESKKEVIRKKIRDLKSRFRYLLQKNNEIPEEARIPRSRFEVEPEVRKPKKLRLMKGVEEVYRRYEWQSAKSIIAIEKIENYFFKDIQTFHMVVKDISHDTQTHTFRHRILTSEFHELLKRTEDSLVQEDIQQKAEMDLPSESYLTKPVAVTRVQARELIGEWESKKYDMKTMHQIRQLEDRLEKRYQRELKWADLNARKIPDDYEDRADVIAIMQAKENLGDYKLKSSEDYTGEKVTAALRRKRVIDMKLKMHEQMKAFNRCVLELRQEKYDILKQCRDVEKELKTIQRKLPPDLQKPIPKIYDMEPCEEPEKDFEITKEAIDARINKKIEELGLTQRRERQKEIENEDSELQSAARKKKDKKSKINKQTTRPATMLPPTRAKGTTGEKETPSTLKYRKAFFKPKTGLANVRLEVALQFRCFQQDMLLKKLSKLIGYFHDRVEKIRDERVALQVDILLMSVRRLQLIQELDIVKEFDTSERAVLERFNAQKVETQEAKNRLDRVQRRLSKVKQDLVKMEQAIQDVSKEVAVVIGEKQKFSDFLWKVYKKKIRVDVPGGEEEGSEMAFARHVSSSSSSTGESSDSTSQDSGSDLFKLPKQKLNPNVCPDQLDKSLYEKVCELRAKRTQMEIEAEAQKRVVEKVGKDFGIVENVYNKFTGRLEGIGEEVLILQRKRQAKMNALPSVVVLKADQIQCLDEDDFDEFSGSIVQRMKHHFPDVKDVVLFPKDGIGKLDLRIEELKDETKAERAKHKRARHMMVRLKEELLKLEQEVNQVNYRCRREMMAKFGKVVDLDDVCAAIINLEILDELTRLENRRNWHYRERKKIADEIEKARDRLTFLTKENSENNTLLAILIERQRDVEYFLFQQQQKEVDRQELLAEKDSSELLTLEEDFDLELISNEDALEELFNLEDILTRQESRIMILREAIAACKFKSGLPPLIPLRSVKDDIATSYMTMNELYALRARKNLDVETIYMGKDAEKIGESHSTFPSFISPQESGRAGWGEPHQHDAQQHPESRHESTFVAQRADDEDEEEGLIDDAEAFTDETDVEEEEKVKDGDNDDEEEGEEGELFNTEYKPPNDEKLDDEEEDEGKEGPSYPLNVIPDDQMPGEEEDEQVIVEEYEQDPLPVEQALPSDDEEEEEGADKV